MPEMTLPTIDVNKAAADLGSALTEINEALRDAAYVAIGFGVIGFQRAQVRRVELTKQLESQLGSLNDLPSSISAQFERLAQTALPQTEAFRSQLNDFAKAFEGQIELIRNEANSFAKTFEERIQPVRKQVDEQLDTLEERLPDAARGVVQSLRSAAAAQEQLLRGVAGLDA